MESQLRELIGGELRRRHALGLMESKIKPVHIANALMREEHRVVGRMSELKHLMTATSASKNPDERLEAARTLVERSRERWGRLGEEQDLRTSVLMTKVLPLLRTILATDGAAFGASPDFSSFSSPTALTVTRDPSDDHAGEVLHRLWNGAGQHDRLRVLDLLHSVTDPKQTPGNVDDLTAVLMPLATETREYTPSEYHAEDLATRPFTAIELTLREAAEDLTRYEDAMRSKAAPSRPYQVIALVSGGPEPTAARVSPNIALIRVLLPTPVLPATIILTRPSFAFSSSIASDHRPCARLRSMWSLSQDQIGSPFLDMPKTPDPVVPAP